LFNTFRFSVEGLDEWVGISGIKVETRLKERTTSITYVPPEKISLNLNNGMKLLIGFSQIFPSLSNQKEAKITQKTYFELISEQECPLNEFILAAYKITTFLGFAIDKTVCIKQVSATSEAIHQDICDGIIMPVSIALFYTSLPYTKDEPNIDLHRMLFRFEQIRQDAERLVNKWFDAYDEINPALNLYLSTKIGAHKYLDGKFLALAQGLETYHRRTSNEKLMDEVAFQELTEKLIQQCPKEKQEWLSGRLKHGNEINLGQRIKKIIEPFKELLGTSIERRKLTRAIVDTRNYLTHYDPSLESVSATGRDLWILCRKMEVIFQLHLLQILGFTQLEIKSVFDNSNELKQKLKEI
jgi:ApeA N-terminal domain 1